MGWADCGTDSEGTPIGYAFEAVCDHPGCENPIDRGLSYACGGMHGEGSIQGVDIISCEKYFCEYHLISFWVEIMDDEGKLIVERDGATVCPGCLKLNEAAIEEEAKKVGGTVA